MCGIAGFSHPPSNAQPIIRLMMQKIVHRGPDDNGVFVDKRVCFGHQRLSIIDLKSGHQPMSNHDQSLWIIFNGEIYNYVELNRELAARGHQFATSSDTETILHLYDEYGEKCVDYLNGMFAFVIYDVKKNCLFASRDRFGIKPFYYTSHKDQFIFASEIKAILAYPEIQKRVNRRALTEYVVLQFCMGEKTLFEGIHKLEPAHNLHLNLTTGEIRIWEYWRPSYEKDLQLTEADATAQFSTLLHDSIRMQLRSDVPLGAYLSGGLDSSTVACLAAEMIPGRLKTFTGSFHEKGKFDETPFAKAVAASKSNIDYFEIFPNSNDFITHIRKLIYHMDEPCAGPGLFPQFMVSQLAAQNVKVVLGGQGGDELFGGYARYFLLYMQQALQNVVIHPSTCVKTFRTLWQKRELLQAYFPSLKRLYKGGRFGSPWSQRYFRLVNRAEKASEFFEDDLLDPQHMASIEEEFSHLFNQPNTPSLFEKAAYFDLKTLLPALLQVEDRVSMAVSLESRVPLLDHRVMDLLGRIPAEIKFRNGEMKHLFKNVAKNIVPESIYNRKDKMGFPVPLVQWTRGPIKGYLHDIFLSQRSTSRGIFKNKTIIKQLGNEQPFGRDLWGALCLELWFENFIDSSSEEETSNENINHRGRGLYRVQPH